MDVGVPELLIILVLALLIFGPKQLPKLARSLGQAVREFRHASQTGAAEGSATHGVSDHEPPPTA